MKTVILAVAMTALGLISCGILDTPTDVPVCDTTKVDTIKVDTIKSVGTAIQAPLDTTIK